MAVLLSVIGGSFGAALVSGIFALIQSRQARRDKKHDKDDVTQKALRYLMLYIIQERAKEHIRDGTICLDDRRSLHHWHDLYHNGLGGNGDADALMIQVDGLPVDTEH